MLETAMGYPTGFTSYSTNGFKSPGPFDEVQRLAALGDVWDPNRIAATLADIADHPPEVFYSPAATPATPVLSDVNLT